MARDNLKKELQLLLPPSEINFQLNFQMRTIPRSGLSLLRTFWNTSSSSPSDDLTARIVCEWPSMKKSCFSVGPISYRTAPDLRCLEKSSSFSYLAIRI